MEEENQEVKKFITFGELFKKSFDYSIKSFPKAFEVLIISGICIFICLFIGIVLVNLVKETYGLGPLMILPAFIFALAVYFIIWSYAALFVIIVNMETEIKAKEAMKIGWKMVLPLIAIYIWISLIVGGGILCLIIPGILFIIWFSLSPFALFCENMRGRKALLRSKYLIKGYWWNVFGKLLVLIVIGVIFFGLLGLLEKVIPDLKWLWLIFDTVLNIFWAVFLLIFFFLIYRDLSVIKGPMPEDFAGFPKNWAGIVFSILGVIVIGGYLGIILFSENEKYEKLIIHSREGSAKANALILMSAANIYYGDNEGAFPETLDELVPKYIEKIPTVNLGDRNWAGEGKNTWKLDPTPETDIIESDIDNSTTWIYNNKKGLITINKTGVDSKGVPYFKLGNSR